jgi:hypothetical protein
VGTNFADKRRSLGRYSSRLRTQATEFVNRILYNIVSSSLPLPPLSPSLPPHLYNILLSLVPFLLIFPLHYYFSTSPYSILFYFSFGGSIGLPRPVRRLCINFVNYYYYYFFFFFFLILESVSLKACYGLGFSPLSLHLECSFIAATSDEFSVIHSSETPYCDL